MKAKLFNLFCGIVNCKYDDFFKNFKLCSIMNPKRLLRIFLYQNLIFLSKQTFHFIYNHINSTNTICKIKFSLFLKWLIKPLLLYIHINMHDSDFIATLSTYMWPHRGPRHQIMKIMTMMTLMSIDSIAFGFYSD